MSHQVRWKRITKRIVAGVLFVALLVAAGFAHDELQTSRWQAHYLSRITAELGWEMLPGTNDALRPAGNGPSDLRLGYHQLPQWTRRLQEQGFEVTAQARMSPRMAELVDQGLFAIYREKAQAGLDLRDCRGESIARSRYPQRVFESFEALPPLLVNALLFIENRELFEPAPTRNPAIEWDRFAKAVFDRAMRRVDESHTAAGGSTLATQIEKYRHSSEGRTDTPEDKLRQMASASLRAYLDGQNTIGRRRQIVLDYLNTVPLSAHLGFGEVNGIGDGLALWYGRDFDEVVRLLREPLTEPPFGRKPREALAFREALLPRQALAFKQALSLMVAQRRPSFYLSKAEQDSLRELTDTHLRLMAEAGVISSALRDVALPLPLELELAAPDEPPASFVDRKAATAIRARLQSLLGIPRAYDLDRIDLGVDTSLAGRVQRAAGNTLRSLGTTAGAQAAGLYGHHLFEEGDDTSKIVFSFTLYERVEGRNLLRVQTDNLDQPFDLNEGAKLDLGSTSKLRTLVTYLEQVAALHERWQGFDAAQLAALEIERNDAISLWAREYLSNAGDRSLAAMLEAAMQRSYSANPDESFFTGGGLHEFNNFDPADDHRSMTVTEAMARSVNLVFIRLMRDVVRHVMAESAEASAALLEDRDDPRRREYLARFADNEGRAFLSRFWRKYAGKKPAEAEEMLLQRTRESPSRLASAYYGLEPNGDVRGLARFLAQRMPEGEPPSADDLAELHEKYRTGRWSLTDRGYLAGVHPLELWVVGWLRKHPQATLTETLAASKEQRQEVYEWLFKTRHKDAQDSRIRGLLEIEAFIEIHRAWKRLGYPFESLTPSYASALGASGDRPAALAELMGIIVNGGLRMPMGRIQSLQFATGTPYETHVESRPGPPERVMKAEVADVLRRALINVVETGTAKRLKGALTLEDGSVVPIGGKTGTGDHRFDTFGRGGKLLSSRVVSRSATLVFLLGDRYFGTIMAYAREPDAEHFKFTSALPSQLLKALMPTLQPLVEGPTCTRPIVLDAVEQAAR